MGDFHSGLLLDSELLKAAATLCCKKSVLAGGLLRRLVVAHPLADDDRLPAHDDDQSAVAAGGGGATSGACRIPPPAVNWTRLRKSACRMGSGTRNRLHDLTMSMLVSSESRCLRHDTPRQHSTV